MSLQVWLPLNGNLNNHGLSNVTITNYGATVDNNGKIGKCYYFNGSSYIKISLPSSITSLKNTTICMWIKGNQAFGGISHDGNADVPCMTCFNPWQFTDGSNWKYISGGTYNDGNWHHVVCTMDDTTIRTYIDGSLVTTNSISSLGIITDLTSSNFIELGCDHPGGDEYLTGYINDFRVYDECISPKMVKEISKGLVCHYPLKSQYETGQVNKYSGDVAEGYLTGGFTRTKLEGERGYNYKLSYTGTGDDMWYALHPDSTFPFTVGKRYYYSCKVRCHSTNFSLSLRASRSYNDWVTNMTNVLAKADGEWHEYVVSQVINETYDRSGSTETCNPILEFYTNNLKTSGTIYSADFDIKDIQVIESDCYVPFIDNNMVSNVVSDCSGYGNNGTKVGNIAWRGDSPRYSGSYNFNGTGYVKNTSFNLNATEMTISFWVKIPETITSQHFLFGTFNSWTDNGIGYWRDVGNNFYCGILRSSAESSHASLPISAALTANTWYHIAIVYTGTECVLYVNGIENERVTYGKNGTIENPVCYLGNSLYNNTPSSETDESSMSDFRIYAIALSAEDIEVLYNTSASIDKTGVLSAYEFVEEG